MKIRRLTAVVAAVLSSVAATPLHAEWVEAKTKHFTMYGDMSVAKITEMAQQAETFDQLIRQFVKTTTEVSPRNDKVDIYVVPTLSSLEGLGRGDGVAGFYAGTAQGAHTVVPAMLPRGYSLTPTQILFHEYAHHVLLSSTAVAYPSWVDEGMAEFFGTTVIRDLGGAFIGMPAKSRAYDLQDANLISMVDMLDIKRGLKPEQVGDKYAKGWLTIHYLLLGGKRPGQFDAYLKGLRDGKSSLEAGKAAFGDLAKLDAEVNLYRKGAIKAYKIATDGIAKADVTVRKLTACEAAIMPHRMRSAIGVNDKTAKALIGPARAASANCAGDAFVQRALAEMEFDAKNDTEAAAAADRALALDPGNIMALVYKGRVAERAKQFAEARKLYIKANKLDPNFALPLVAYHDSFVREGKAVPKAAMDGLLRAAVLVPQDDALRFKIGLAWLQEGALKDAYEVLKPYRENQPDKPGSVDSIMTLIEQGVSKDAVLAEVAKGKLWGELYTGF